MSVAVVAVVLGVAPDAGVLGGAAVLVVVGVLVAAVAGAADGNVAGGVVPAVAELAAG